MHHAASADGSAELAEAALRAGSCGATICREVVMDDMRAEYHFGYQKARPNRFAGRTKHRVVIEKADGNLSAYSPDLPGCVATGKTREQVVRNMREAIEMHVEGLMEGKNEKEEGVK